MNLCFAAKIIARSLWSDYGQNVQLSSLADSPKIARSHASLKPARSANPCQCHGLKYADRKHEHAKMLWGPGTGAPFQQAR